ncbi:MAG TPA: 2OG-Fe(II) oxygenase [Xanthomonadales bacterium]|nr:2OG-Fe(II) oxygenase [Xanthomonadales bacterium]
MASTTSSSSSPASLFGKLLNPAVVAAADHLHKQFVEARPFRHVVIEHFFDNAFCNRLLQDFPNFDQRAAMNENGEIGGKATQEKMQQLGPSYRQLDELVQSQEFRQLIGEITGIADLQYDPHYFGGGTHENRQGQDLDPHVDFNFHPITRQHRRLNLIVYLNPEWQDDWGGSLQLHKNPYLEPGQDEITTLTPLFNRCVIFETTESSWHGFERISLPAGRQDLSRKSFALYYYTDTRPADETADEHSTVYVERHLPSHIQPGLTLGEADVQVLKTLLARRDQHMRRLYRNIQNLYGENNRLRSGQLAAGETNGNEVPDADQQQLQQLVRGLRTRVRELETSTSWRVTKPLRALKRMFSRGA